MNRKVEYSKLSDGTIRIRFLDSEVCVPDYNNYYTSSTSSTDTSSSWSDHILWDLEKKEWQPKKRREDEFIKEEEFLV